MKAPEEFPLVSVCIPHWQVRDLMSICLRSIRKHSAGYRLEVIVVDNGSCDESLEWLRSIPWIRLVERPEECVANWPRNVFTAWDLGACLARGEFFVTMHSDVFVRSDRWLDPFLREMEASPHVAAVGSWKLELDPAWYAWQKRLLGPAVAGVKRLFGRKVRGSWRQAHFPRDYCAMYRRDVLLRHGLTFCPTGDDALTGGWSIARQLWQCGYDSRMISLSEMSQQIVHLAHGTAGQSNQKPLRHRRAQLKAQRRAQAVLAEPWVRELRAAELLDVA